MNRLCIVAKSAIFLAGLGLATAYAQAPPPVQPTLVCGIEVYPSPTGFPEAEPEAITDQEVLPVVSGDPCQDGSTVFGPTRFERSTGKPIQEISEFILDADADVCIISNSGAKGKASIFVDGINIAEPEDFDDQIDVYTDSLVAGSHGLGVRAVGKPGGYLDVEVRQLGSGGGGDPDLPAPGEVKIDPKSGAVDMVSADGNVRLQNVMTDHPLLTPNGDGHHDTTTFQALTTPLVTLPGKDDGSVDYFLDWEFQIVDLATCNTIDTGLSGSTQINSPTLVETLWDGTAVTGAQLPTGIYSYLFFTKVVDEFGIEFGIITPPAFGLVIDDSLVADTVYDERVEQLGECNAVTDFSACKCPGVDGAPGTPDPNCAFSFVKDLLPEGNFPSGAPPNYYAPDTLDLSFITTTLNPVTGRYTVTVDLRDHNAMGLVPKGLGFWPNEASLRQWVSDMTGVPLGTGEGLFNFDFVQIGTSTGVGLFGPAFFDFNHFFLDAMTDAAGRIFVGSALTDLRSEFNYDNAAPAQYVVAGREGDECTNSGNTDGDNTILSKFCAYNTAVKIGDTTDLGIYTLRTTMFDLRYNDEKTRQDKLCVIDGIFTCGVRTVAVPVDKLEIESSYYEEGGEIPIRTVTDEVSDATGMSVTVDRADGDVDGVCSHALAVLDGLAVRMDAADGSVPDSCIINGIF